ncbi:RxLR effector protein [Phytophthora megakarya]|uniref:RxLR effector protein n=1 Tax=Phytophthora megakarya TaxID=4795 RepID=A0A225VFF9_9STRA|nr:RxLR effector protein [Phytophthora megakarya]
MSLLKSQLRTNGILIKQNLWTTGISQLTTEDDSDRAFNTAKLKEVAEGGVQNFSTATKNLVEGVKLKFTSDKQKATNILCIRLEVDQVGSDLFNSAQFKAWAISVTLFAAEEIPETAMIVLQLETWVTKNLPADDVFQFLKLDTTGDNLLKCPLLRRWMKFVKKVGKENPYELVFLKLANRYDDENLANMLLETKHQLGAVVNGLTAEKSADYVFNMLKLQNDNPNKILRDPMLNIWISYVVKLEAEYPVGAFRPYELLMAKLAKHYNDEKLVEFILASKKWKSTRWNPDGLMFHTLVNQYGKEGLKALIAHAKKSKATETIALKLQQELGRSEGITADSVFELLKINYSGGIFLESPKLSIWEPPKQYQLGLSHA